MNYGENVLKLYKNDKNLGQRSVYMANNRYDLAKELVNSICGSIFVL